MLGRRSPVAALLLCTSMFAACTAPSADRANRDEARTTTSLAVPTTTVPTTAVPAFRATVSPVTAAALASSWRAGCPVGPSELRLLSMAYWGFDDRPHVGSMVVRASVTQAVLAVFGRLYDERFPVRRMEPVDAYGGSDEASTAADDTAGFNCRNAVSSGSPHWSAHAYGLAIDVNPVENPYFLDGAVLPPAGVAYADRSVVRPGMAVAGGALTEAFEAVGWPWGGRWSSPDHQHFSATGG